ncbi:MAG TPA: DUF1579 domain-containing protein [Nitrosomonas sp.]|nr:DUF1579 domain-containing protein [Nitrosomonas sp.]HRB33879.1 DUF1579 domain-containing protein [Nitrosomonas sp.]HRB46797.1 DUF1579 domain-containing protein [Nitrosomonas sp.]HRB78530.1 DUF1579 domain-containing protein [Nitrosomonas sp.]
MRITYLIVTSLCIALMAPVAVAKDLKATKPMDHQAMMELYQKLATPGEPHSLLANLAGSWDTKTKEWMESGKPPMESAGTVEIKSVLGGRFIQEDYTGNMMGQPFFGLSMTGYDNLQKRYVTAWMSTMGTGMFIMEGTASADGKTITLTGKHPEPGGGFMTHRAIWKIVDNNNQTFDMYGAHHGQKEMKNMEIVYMRKQ